MRRWRASPGCRCGPTRASGSRRCFARAGCSRLPTARWRRSSRPVSGPTASSRSATGSAMPTAGIIRTSTCASRSTSRRRARTAIASRPRSSATARLVADRSVPARERLAALAFLVHFVGDLHQPMHAGDHGDLGGNRVAANYGDDRRAGESPRHLGRLAGRARDFNAAGRACGAAGAGSAGRPGADRVGGTRRGLEPGDVGERRATGLSQPGRRPVRPGAGRASGARRSGGPRADPAGAGECRRRAGSGWPSCSTMRSGRRQRRPARSASAVRLL